MALEHVTGVTGHRVILTVMNRKVRRRQTTMFVNTNRNRAISLYNDCILTEFANALLAGLPKNYPLSSNFRASDARKQAYAREVDKNRDFYSSKDYEIASLNGCHTALRDIIFCGSTACCNIKVTIRTVTSTTFLVSLQVMFHIHSLFILIFKLCTYIYSIFTYFLTPSNYLFIRFITSNKNCASEKLLWKIHVGFK